MTSKTHKSSGQRSNNDRNADAEFDKTPVQMVLGSVKVGMSYARRMTLFVPVFGVIFLAIGFMWFQGVQEERTIKTESASLRTLLDLPSPQPDALLAEASGWDTAYKVVFEKRTARSADSDLVGGVIRAAEKSGLTIVETGTADDGMVKLEQDSYTVTPILIKTKGSLDEIEDFLRILESDEFAAFEIQATLLSREFLGFMLTIRGVYYSLPEDFSDQLIDDEDVPVIPVGPVGSDDAEGVSP